MACLRGFLGLFLLAFVLLALSLEQGCGSNVDIDTINNVLRFEPLLRLKELGNVSDVEGRLQRTFLSPAAIQAGQLIEEWMRDAGLTTWVDHIGNVHGRVQGGNGSAPAILLGSHLDTVIDAGMYDGALGIISAIAAVKALRVSNKLNNFPRPIEVIAFSDEEGVRFQSTFLGSMALSGSFPMHLLQATDQSGITLQAALQGCSFDGTEDSLTQIKYNSDSIWGYVEVHIEQGPVLERQGIPLGVVVAIAGQTRLSVKVQGSQGHAGTVPMAMRRDPMPAAAEAIVAIENLCNHPEKYLEGSWEMADFFNHLISEGALVCTVGEIGSWPGTSNVIPGQVMFTIDVRAEDDYVRKGAVFNIERKIQEICGARGVSCNIEHKHEASSTKCSPELEKRLQAAATSVLSKISTVSSSPARPLVPRLISGAGHDAMAISQLAPIGMLFVRCTGGISHSPAEHVLEDDIWAASLAITAFLEDELRTGRAN
eukprot:c27989_g1_i2 orf=778-2229(+)